MSLYVCAREIREIGGDQEILRDRGEIGEILADLGISDGDQGGRWEIGGDQGAQALEGERLTPRACILLRKPAPPWRHDAHLHGGIAAVGREAAAHLVDEDAERPPASGYIRGGSEAVRIAWVSEGIRSSPNSVGIRGGQKQSEQRGYPRGSEAVQIARQSTSLPWKQSGAAGRNRTQSERPPVDAAVEDHQLAISAQSDCNPSAHQSTPLPWPLERIVSGARYSGVPQRVHVRSSIFLANPKSQILQ